MNTDPSTTPIRRHALLIGINEYDADHLQDLRAPRNDVIAWFRFLRRIGVPAADIQVVTSPVLSPEELDAEGAEIAFATRETVGAAFEKLRDDVAKAGSNGFGIVFVAGHGSYSGGANLSIEMTSEPTLSLTNAMKGLDKLAITWLIDVCRPFDAGYFNGLADVARPSETHVVVAGSHQHQLTQERYFDGAWHGELTWAAITILRNWPSGRIGPGATYIQVTPEVLVARMTDLMCAFNASGREQKPVYAKLSTLSGPLFLPGRPESTADYAVAAPTHEFGPGTCDIRVGTTVLANCSKKTTPTPEGWKERRDWVVLRSTTSDTTAESFVAQLTGAWTLTVYDSAHNPATPAVPSDTFQGGPRAANPVGGDPCGDQTSLAASYPFVATLNGVTLYANVWHWPAAVGGVHDRIGIALTLVAPSGAQIPPGIYNFTTCSSVGPIPNGQNAYVWVDNLNP